MDVDRELPWIRPWFLRYQMSNGGLNCEGEAYLVKDEVPSSMVGTIAVFEAILLHTPRPWTAEEEAFLDKGARFLMERKLMLGSATKHDADEQKSAKEWIELCFPRFYFYDILRGLNALLLWSEKTGRPVHWESIHEVVTLLDERFPNGQVRCERRSYEGTDTMIQSPTGEWLRRWQLATLFPLLVKTSMPGEVSPFLSRQWAEARARLKKAVSC